MVAALLSALVTAAVSAFVPVTPVEPYLVVLATAGDQPAVPLSVAAAVGQTAGKLLIFLATRATVRSGWAAKVAGRYGRKAGRIRTALRRTMALLDRPALVAPTVFASAVVGVPPLLAVSVHAARTPVSAPVFALCCAAGRTLRFLAIMTAPDLL